MRSTDRLGRLAEGVRHRAPNLHGIGRRRRPPLPAAGLRRLAVRQQQSHDAVDARHLSLVAVAQRERLGMGRRREEARERLRPSRSQVRLRSRRPPCPRDFPRGVERSLPVSEFVSPQSRPRTCTRRSPVLLVVLVVVQPRLLPLLVRALTWLLLCWFSLAHCSEQRACGVVLHQWLVGGRLAGRRRMLLSLAGALALPPCSSPPPKNETNSSSAKFGFRGGVYCCVFRSARWGWQSRGVTVVCLLGKAPPSSRKSRIFCYLGAFGIKQASTLGGEDVGSRCRAAMEQLGRGIECRELLGWG